MPMLMTMRSLRLRWHPQRLARCFSSRPSNPSLVDGFDGVRAFVRRCRDRAGDFTIYRRQELFAPFPLVLSDLVLFVQLQQPTNTQIDLHEFLRGATHAYNHTIRTMFSDEFRRFANGTGDKTADIAQVEAALWPNCWLPHLLNLRASKDEFDRVELRDVTIRSAQLVAVEWVRVPLSVVRAEEKYAQDATQKYLEQRFAKEKLDEDSAESLEEKIFELIATQRLEGSTEKTEDAVVEQLRLDLYFDTVEHLMATASDGSSEVLVREVDTVVQFGSLVTSPEELDWRIVRFKHSTSSTVEDDEDDE